jgi:hypothetical protein
MIGKIINSVQIIQYVLDVFKLGLRRFLQMKIQIINSSIIKFIKTTTEIKFSQNQKLCIFCFQSLNFIKQEE